MYKFLNVKRGDDFIKDCTTLPIDSIYRTLSL